MKVWCAILVGPGEAHRHLDRVLRLSRHWSDGLIVRLDGADAATSMAVMDQPHLASVANSEQRLFLTDESAARNGLMEQVDATADAGDLVVVLDADEELVSLSSESPRAELALAGAGDRSSWPVMFVHLWHPEGGLMRVDGGWRPGYAVRIYRHQPGLRIAPRTFACAPVPTPLRACCPLERSPFAIKHWGYAYPHDRERKRAFYADRDGGRFHSVAHLESITTEPTLEEVWL